MRHPTPTDSSDALEVLAYADGQLDNDPEARARVEALLAADPVLAARAHAYRAQTDALREAYAHRTAEPLPSRLTGALETRPQSASSTRSIGRVAAALTLVLAGMAGGWVLGRAWDAPLPQAAWSADGLWDQVDGLVAATPTGNPGNATEQPLEWLSRQLSLMLRAPDLSGLGYTLKDIRAVRQNGVAMVRLSYQATDGAGLSLFLRPRWQQDEPPLQVAENGDVALAYWLDGPLAAAVVASRSGPEIRSLAQAVRRAMSGPTPLPAGMQEPIPFLAPGPAPGPAPVPADLADGGGHHGDTPANGLSTPGNALTPVGRTGSEPGVVTPN